MAFIQLQSFRTANSTRTAHNSWKHSSPRPCCPSDSNIGRVDLHIHSHSCNSSVVDCLIRFIVSLFIYAPYAKMILAPITPLMILLNAIAVYTTLILIIYYLLFLTLIITIVWKGDVHYVLRILFLHFIKIRKPRRPLALLILRCIVQGVGYSGQKAYLGSKLLYPLRILRPP